MSHSPPSREVVADEIKLLDFPVFLPSEFNMSSSVSMFPLNNYSFGKKDSILVDQFASVSKSCHMETFLSKGFYCWLFLGMVKSVEAVLLVHQHTHPHVLLLQKGSNFALYEEIMVYP